MSNAARQRLREHQSRYSTLSKNDAALEYQRNKYRAAYYENAMRAIGDHARTIGELQQMIRRLEDELEDCRSQNGVLGAVVKGVVSRSKRLGNYFQSPRRVTQRTTG